jgi:hypothetical protein
MPEQLREQTAGFPSHFPAVQERRQDTYRRPVRTDDVDEDTLYDMRSPNSTRRYAPPVAPPRTVMRVTHHNIPPRASLHQALTQDEQNAPGKQPTVQRARPRVHWLAPVGVGMVLMLVLYLAGSIVHAWGVDQYNTLHYGYPRTYQIDANVQHGGISHFIVVNLHGHVFVTEILANDPGNTKIYVGPVITGAGADREPVTISFQDANKDGRLDMWLKVGTTVYLWLNTGSAFRPAAAQQSTISG